MSGFVGISFVNRGSASTQGAAGILLDADITDFMVIAVLQFRACLDSFG